MEYNRHKYKMKKIIFAIVAVTIIAMSGIVNAASYETAKNTTSDMVQSSYSVTVMWIRNNGSVWMKTKKTGNYDSNENTISVNGSTYRVQDNPYYGSDDPHGRDSYRYVAGGEYYFNL